MYKHLNSLHSVYNFLSRVGLIHVHKSPSCPAADKILENGPLCPITLAEIFQNMTLIHNKLLSMEEQ